MKQSEKIRAILDSMDIYADEPVELHDTLARLFEVLQDEIRIWKRELLKEEEAS